MPTVTVHNISDRPNTPGEPVSLVIGGQKLRPGRSLVIDAAVLNDRHRGMHGTRIWIGKQLPSRFRRTSKSALRGAVAAAELARSSAMTLEEARLYLSELPLEQLLELATAASPPVDLRPGLSKGAVLSRLSRAIFQPERELDPELYFWLGRWTRESGGYAPKE